MSMYKQILYATDLTEEIRHIDNKVKKIAELYGAKLSVVHVVEHLAAVAYSYMGSVDIEEQLVEEAQKEMKKLAKKLDIDEKNQYLKVGHPKTEVVEVAEEIGADLIVVGSHGRHGIMSVLGSTTNAILHDAHCDVLTVRATKKQ